MAEILLGQVKPELYLQTLDHNRKRDHGLDLKQVYTSLGSARCLREAIDLHMRACRLNLMDCFIVMDSVSPGDGKMAWRHANVNPTLKSIEQR